MEPLLNEIFDGTIDGDAVFVAQKVSEALEVGIEPERILDKSLIAAMAEVGALFEEGEYFVPEMLVAARAMKSGLAVLRPRLANSHLAPAGRVITGTVKDDLHDIGKNLVGIMLEGAGFEVHDLGVDVAPQQVVDAVRAGNVDIVALSALLTTTMRNMQATIDALHAAGLRRKVKVIVGGAPVTERFAISIGADGYAPDASQAIKLAKALLPQRADSPDPPQE